jgi:hypothetical protein
MGKLAGLLRTLCIWGLVVGAAIVVGRPLAPASEGAEAKWRIPVALGAGLFLLSNAVLLIAVLGILTPAVLWVIVTAPIVAASPRIAREVRARFTRLRGWRPRLPWWGWISVALLLVPLLDAFVPDYGWDALTYHLALPETFLRVGRMVVTPFSHFSTAPHGMQMIYTLALGLDGPALAKLMNLTCGLLACGCLALLGLRVSRRAAMLAPAILLANPLVQWEMTVAYIDLAVTAYALLAVIAVNLWLDTGDRRWLLRCGLFAGAAVAVRWTGISLVAVIAGLLLVVGRRLGLVRRIGHAAVMALVAGVALAPWLVRSAIYTGNPVSPFLQGLFAPGREFLDPFVIRQWTTFLDGIGMGKDPLALLALPWNLTMRSRDGVYHHSFGFVVGVVEFVGALAALTCAKVRGIPEVRRALLVAAGLILAWFFTEQEARHLLPVYALLALAAAAAYDRLAHGPSWLRRLGLAVPIAALALAAWGLLGRLGYEWGYAVGTLSTERLELSDPAFRVAEVLRRNLPAGRRVLLVLESRGFLFRGLDTIPDVPNECSPVMRMIHKSATPEDLLCRLASLGVTDVVVNANFVEHHPTFLDDYTPTDYQNDLARLRTLLDRYAHVLVSQDGVSAAALHGFERCPSAKGPPVPPAP